VKCTFDEGCFLMFNTAQEVIDSDNGLISTVAYKLGPNEKVCYALEGAVANAGNTFHFALNLTFHLILFFSVLRIGH
jgi:glycerol kinase